MDYKILYIEDNDPSSIIGDLEQYGFILQYHEPKEFESSINITKKSDAELILLDFRLTGKGAAFDAPTIAQTLRTIHSDQKRDIPIVLISSEENISGYYKDFTSQDLFDLAIPKNQLSQSLKKYTNRFKDLIVGYKDLATTISSGKPLDSLLKIPDFIKEKISPKAIDSLSNEKYIGNSFMASSFIWNHVVRPSGLLIGEDILAARLGIAKDSKNWGELKGHLECFKYTGIFSKSYDRWWSKGLELWWETEINNESSLRRLEAAQRAKYIIDVLKLKNLKPAERGEHARSDYFWTVCMRKKTPLDPIDGFEKDVDKNTWEDPEYFSLIGVSELESTKTLKMLDRKRYKDETREL